MLEVIALLAILVGVVGFLMQIMIRWGTVQLGSEVSVRMCAAESIVNHRSLPETWVKPYRRRIAAMRQAGKSQDNIARVGRQAQMHCLREIDSLLRFFEHSAVVDSTETRSALLTALQAQRARWATADWQALLATDASTAAASS